MLLIRRFQDGWFITLRRSSETQAVCVRQSASPFANCLPLEPAAAVVANDQNLTANSLFRRAPDSAARQARHQSVQAFAPASTCQRVMMVNSQHPGKRLKKSWMNHSRSYRWAWGSSAWPSRIIDHAESRPKPLTAPSTVVLRREPRDRQTRSGCYWRPSQSRRPLRPQRFSGTHRS